VFVAIAPGLRDPQDDLADTGLERLRLESIHVALIYRKRKNVALTSGFV
jgi:hypothetical protein